MKNIISKIGLVFVIGLVFNFNTKAQLTLTCESGNRTTEQAACWGFGSTTYINTIGTGTHGSYTITGSYSAQSNQLTNPGSSACWVKTPWMKVGSGNITLKAKLSAVNGTTRGIVFSYIPYNPLNPPYYEGVPVVYDSTKWTAINVTLKNITSIIPAAIANSNEVYKIRISFVGTGGNSRIISDDYVIPGTYWSDPSNGCIPLPTIQDADIDGVADADDAFPNDQYKAYKTYSPVQNQFSTLAFEDLWPSTGDFDFNDLVLDYNSELVSNAQNQVVEVNYQFKVRAIGASFRNGFGFELTNINPNAIRNVSGAIIKAGSVYNVSSNGTESGQTNATIIAIGEVNDVLPYPGGGVSGINTTVGAPYVTPQIVNVKVVFMENGVPGSAGAINISQLGSNIFNPFMVVNQNRGKEIHLPDYKPTSLADLSLIGTMNDDSKPGIGRYYRTKTNLPFAIRTYESFKYPKEKTEISKSYLKLIDWVINNGTQYLDWDTNETYKDNNFIYTHP